MMIIAAGLSPIQAASERDYATSDALANKVIEIEASEPAERRVIHLATPFTPAPGTPLTEPAFKTIHDDLLAVLRDEAAHISQVNEESDAFRKVSEWIDEQAAANSISTLINEVADSLTISSPVELRLIEQIAIAATQLDPDPGGQLALCLALAQHHRSTPHLRVYNTRRRFNLGPLLEAPDGPVMRLMSRLLPNGFDQFKGPPGNRVTIPVDQHRGWFNDVLEAALQEPANDSYKPILTEWLLLLEQQARPFDFLTTWEEWQANGSLE